MQAGLNHRQKLILQQLHTKGEVKVSELKEIFDVTDMTIRRDLEKMERSGLLKRTFGGAILVSKDVALRERSVVHWEEKERIGRLAASLVQTGESIFIDGGSTTFQVARHLPEEVDITVVTNAINVAAELSEKKISTIVLGGILIDTTKSMVGPVTLDTISRMAFDKVFLGATGFHPQHGFSNSNIHEAEIKRVAIQKAKEVYIVLDHSKFGKSSLVSFANLKDVHSIVTDESPSAELYIACQTSGTNILVANDVRMF
jgi:DeoR family transcriptional regulator, fructose operon transcriptional repressor